MPELPEVETIARTLAPIIEGKIIVSHVIYNKATIHGEIKLDKIIGTTIGKPSRRGKLLLIPLFRDGINKFTICFHLKMTGRVLIYSSDTSPGPHTRIVFYLNDNQSLFFEDIRKFGYVRVLSPESFQSWQFWNTLGEEPLEIDSLSFAKRFQGRKAKIKALLLDQRVIAGCGNIYADESLFRAGILPMTQAFRLSLESLFRLHQALKEVFLESISACGSSIKDYRTARGDVGAFQNSFRVYGRAGNPCIVCGEILRSTRINGRMTVWCSTCQVDNW